MTPIRTRALLLKQVDTGEADRVVTLLTETRGKVSAIARGARKSRKRYGAALGLFVLAEAELRKRSGSELYVLSAYDAQQTFPHISLDLAAIAHGSYLTELVGALCPTGHAEPELYQLLLQGYRHLDEHPASAEALRVMEYRALAAAGLAPQLDACVRCGAALVPNASGGFDVDRGGAVCQACCRAEEAIRGDTFKALRRLARVSLADAPHQGWSAETCTELRRTLGGSITSTLGRPLKSVQFIRKVSGS